MPTIPMPPTTNPRVLDFGPGRRAWGHDYMIHEVIAGGHKLRLSGHGDDPQPGDYILLDNQGRSTRYLIESAEHYIDPEDMWNAVVVFAPREAP